MKKLTTLLLLALLTALHSFAQIRVISSWIINNNGATGYNSILANVQKDQFDSSNVYISCTDIPLYNIGPWPSDPNYPTNQNFVYKITRNPVKNTGTPTSCGLGHVGVLINGVSIFNSQDANSYNNKGYWHQNAYYFEGASFDSCNGHPSPTGEYHHHVNPKCLYNDADSSQHSPIIGYAFDGFPVYGPYGYANTNGTGGIKRMTSSYQMRTSMVNRDTLPNGTILAAANYGPAVSVSYPLGDYVEDYKYIAGSGTLDTNNGRYCVTPEYPGGIYAYFVTVDSKLKPVYPYFIGLTYYGVVQSGNTGPGSGNNTVPSGTKTYTGINEPTGEIAYTFKPNPVKDYASVYFAPGVGANIKAMLYNTQGQLLKTYENWHAGTTYTIEMTTYPEGLYLLRMELGNKQVVQKIMKVR